MTMWVFVLACVLPSLAGAWYQPHSGTRFQIQLAHGFDYSMSADLYEADLWVVTRSISHAIHSKGAHVVCYFSGGTYDPNRPDVNNFDMHHDVGNEMKDWPGERYVNIMSQNVRNIMSWRMDEAKNRGCDAVDPDNLDAWQANDVSGFHFTKAQQIDYNSYLADQAHKKGLGIGLKNCGYLADTLAPRFDWVLDESCHDWGNQCYLYNGFLSHNKPVFNIEYVPGHSVDSHNRHKCTSGSPHHLQTQFKVKDLDAWVYHCPGQ